MSAQSLWAAVLYEVIQDALHGPTATDHADRAERIHRTHYARRYLTRPNRDFNEVCSNAGLNPQATRASLIKQIAQAPSPEQLVTQSRPAKNSYSLRAITYDNQTKTIPEWAEHTGIPVHTIANRLKRGLPPEHALDPNHGKPKPITYNGKTLTIPEWSERTGLSVDLIRSRLRTGWPIERALTTPKVKPNSKPSTFNAAPRAAHRPAKTYEHDGQAMTLAQWAKHTGIPVGTLRSRIAYGWSMERVLTEPVQEKVKRNAFL